MSWNDKSVEYRNEYIKNNYDRVSLLLPKGDKEKLKAIADSQGLSLNAFINQAIAEKCKNCPDF